MFLSRCLLLVPMILATKIEVQINNYVVKTDDSILNALVSIEVIDDPPEELNLSGLRLQAIYDNAFENVTHIKILDLSNNSLYCLAEEQFASLTNLELLNLSRTNISRFTKAFVGLNNLKVLDLSYTKITDLKTSDFFGLPKSCVILLKGNVHVRTISTELFEDESRTVNFTEVNHPQVEDNQRVIDNDTYYGGKTIHIKICINYTELISAEHYTEDENLASDCVIATSHLGGVLSLSSLGIGKFRKGWYKLQDLSIHHIDLSSNNITRLTRKVLNDLPESISVVNLAHNNIKRLRRGFIVNEHLRELHLAFNSIIEIKDDVFINTNLTTLTLSHNQLTDTKFAATLPTTLTKIELEYNELTEISNDSFSKLNKLEVLMLDENYILEIHRDSFRGLSGLKDLSLVSNKLTKIDAGCLKALTALEVLDLKLNKITELDLGVFADLKNIKKIILSWNSLSNLTRDPLIDLPDSLEVLDLQSNVLLNMKAGIFVNSPKYELLLSNNIISDIEDGSFNLPHLRELVLTYNFVTVMDSGKLQGLKNLQSLWLGHNHIRRIEKGAFKTLGNLCKLVISHNPIKTLENGTLHGLLQEKGCYVEVERVPIEMIHGDVFTRNVDSSLNRLSKSNNTLPKVLKKGNLRNTIKFCNDVVPTTDFHKIP